MIVILDSNENILEFMDDAQASVTITDTYTGYKALDFDCELTNVKHDQYLFKQGNKIFLENVLFVINTEVEVDYVGNTISLEAEEVVCELNTCEPFYINASQYSRFRKGTTITISADFLNALLDGFYTVDKTDLQFIEKNLKMITVNGTITRYKLMKEIEETTGLVFKYNYSLNANKIIKKASLLKPENYGVSHDMLLNRVVVGENTNKLEYCVDETKNALGIMPIVKSENTTTVDYTKILQQFYNLDINNEKVMPYYSNYGAVANDIVVTAKTLYDKIISFGHIPDTIPLLFFNEEKTLNIGMSQFLDMVTKYIADYSDIIKLLVVEPPLFSDGTILDCVFEESEIYTLARNVQEYIQKSGNAPTGIVTRHGKVSFQWLIYIFSEYLSTKKRVVCKSTEYPNLNKVLPEKVEYNVKYIVDNKDYEYMPFMYTQNTSESNTIPYSIPTINPVQDGKNHYDLDKYISESYPVMTITKQANASYITVTISKKNISQDTAEFFFLGFKDVNLIQDNTDIEIDFNKKEIKFMKFFEVIEEKEIEVTEQVQNDNVITVNMMPSCGCCGGTVPYKRYTKTWKNYCPACGKSGTLTDNPKGVYEGELTCSMSKGGCDADYCGYCGGDKWGGGRCRWRKLTPAEAATETTRKETVQEVHQEYKECIANDDNTPGEDETKIQLKDILTNNSKLDSLYGDVSIKIEGASLKSLKCDSTKLYELSPFPYVKQKGKMFIYAPITSADFNYTHMTNNNPKLEPFETTEQSVEEVLIGCWKKLNGSGDNTRWLDKSEDIKVDLTEEKLDLNAGDFVYIKLPDLSIFKAQIMEKKYDPKIRSDSSLKIGNVSRESIA